MSSDRRLPTPPGASTSPEVHASYPSTFWVKSARSTMLEKKPNMANTMMTLEAAKFRSR